MSRCLNSLVNQTLREELYEVIIVDNNSSDNTQQLAKEYVQNHTNFSLISEMKQGLSHTRNKGWKIAQGKYVAFIDDDAKATSNWCEQIVHAFENVSPAPNAVGGLIYPYYEKKPPKWFSDEFEIRSWGEKPLFLTGNAAKRGFSGSNMAFPSVILEKYGGFSTDYGLKGRKLRLSEDTEFFYRISKHERFFWYDPQIKVYHWTPVHKMRPGYRFLRTYKTGQSLAQMERPNMSLTTYCRDWINFLRFLLKFPYSVLNSQGNRKTSHIKLLEQLASYLGFLLAFPFQNT